MKKLFVIFLMIGFLVSLTASAGNVFAQQKIKLMVSAFPTNFSYYPPTIAINDLVMRHTNLDITIQSMGGSQAMPGPVEKGKADLLGPLTVTTMGAAFLGVGDFSGNPHPSLRFLMVIGELPQAYMTTAASGITDLSGLKGRKVGKGLTMSQDMPEAILRAYGLDLEKDIRWSKYGGTNDMYKDLALGRIDAFFDSIVGAKMIQLKEQARGDIALLSIGKAEWEKAAAADPQAFIGAYHKFFPLKRIPAVSRPDPVGCTIKPMGIGVSKNLSEDIVYTYVKTIMDNLEAVQKSNARLKGFSADIAVPLPAFPYHDGAVKVYREMGLWTAAHQTAQAKLLK
ncbi:MAG: TAXI family TRAP transporter solute-binding subunit [Desulfobacterales bacterium]|nr:TAXI family TRAP transporter solute-binding subunit [Desulfobacterales bacterium]